MGSWPAIERIRIAASRIGARDRPGLIERGGKRDDAPARAAAIGRLDADGRGERRRLADRAAGVGRGRAHAEQRRHRRGRAAGRAARHQRGVGALAPPRIDHRAEARGLVRRAHRELVIVELAEHHRAVAPELRGHGRIRKAARNCRGSSSTRWCARPWSRTDP